MPPVVDSALCIGCARCAEACQSDVYFGSDKGEVARVVYPEECWHCNACVFECPVKGAVRLRIPLPMMVLYQDRTSPGPR